MSDRFRTTQDRYFDSPDVARHRWVTEDPAFAPVEAALLRPWLDRLPMPCLEIGCGEGSNLVRLAERGHPVGVDLYPGRVGFAARAVPGARVLVGDACRLSFPDGTFAGVLVRDLLHHLSTPQAAAAEAVRVLRPGGLLLLIEPNGRNPLTALQTRLVPAEVRARGFTPEYLLELLAGLPLEGLTMDMAQPFPLRRLVFHYRWGVPALGRTRAGAAALGALERLGGRLLPRSYWSYSVVQARRR